MPAGLVIAYRLADAGPPRAIHSPEAASTLHRQAGSLPAIPGNRPLPRVAGTGMVSGIRQNSSNLPTDTSSRPSRPRRSNAGSARYEGSDLFLNRVEITAVCS